MNSLYCDETLPDEDSMPVVHRDLYNDHFVRMYEFENGCEGDQLLLVDLFLMAPTTDACADDETELVPGAVMGLCAMKARASPPSTPKIVSAQDSGTPSKFSRPDIKSRYPVRERAPTYSNALLPSM